MSLDAFFYKDFVELNKELLDSIIYILKRENIYINVNDIEIKFSYNNLLELVVLELNIYYKSNRYISTFNISYLEFSRLNCNVRDVFMYSAESCALKIIKLLRSKENEK